MSFTDPYRQHNYVGEHANEASVLTAVQALKWDSAGDGTGTPRAGMVYYDTAGSKMKFHNGSAWADFGGVSFVPAGGTDSWLVDFGGDEAGSGARVLLIGVDADSAANNDATAVGYGTTITGASATVLGSQAFASTNGTAIGASARAEDPGCIAIGAASIASGNPNSIVIGINGNLTGANTIGIGASISTAAATSVFIGNGIAFNASNSQSVVVGYAATQGSANCVVIGYNAYAKGATVSIGGLAGDALATSGTNSVYIGVNARMTTAAAGGGCVIIGASATHDAGQVTAIGDSAYGYQQCTVVGRTCSANNPSTGTVVVGYNSTSNNSEVTILGESITCNATASVAIGGDMSITGTGTNQHVIYIGHDITASGNNHNGSVVIGRQANSGSLASSGRVVMIGVANSNSGNYNNFIALGSNLLSTADNQIQIGGQNVSYTMLLGGHRSSGAGSAQTLQSQNAGTTSNVAGGDFIIQAGAGTGTAAGGSMQFKLSPVGASGSTLNPQVATVTLAPPVALNRLVEIFDNGVDATVGLRINYTSTSPGNPFQITRNTSVFHMQIVTTSNQSQLLLNSIDLTDGASTTGPMVIIGNNSNGTNQSSGSLRFIDAGGTSRYLWVDSSGLFRINTSAPLSGTDSGGTVVGDQSSSARVKDILSQGTEPESAMESVVGAARNALRAWKYKNNAYNGEVFPNALVVDYAPRYGMDRSSDSPNGKSLNVAVAIGDLFASVLCIDSALDSMQKEIDQLRDEVKILKAQLQDKG